MRYTKIDKLGRIEIPSAYRKAINISIGSPLKMECKNNMIIITPFGIRCLLFSGALCEDAKIPLCKECIEKIKQL